MVQVVFPQLVQQHRDLAVTGSNTASDTTSTGALTVGGGAGIVGDTHIGGTLTVSGQSILGGGVAFQDTNLEITTNSFDADSSSLVFRKSRNPTDGDHAVAQENDTVGSMLFVVQMVIHLKKPQILEV